METIVSLSVSNTKAIYINDFRITSRFTKYGIMKNILFKEEIKVSEIEDFIIENLGEEFLYHVEENEYGIKKRKCFYTKLNEMKIFYKTNKKLCEQLSIPLWKLDSLRNVKTKKFYKNIDVEEKVKFLWKELFDE